MYQFICSACVSVLRSRRENGIGDLVVDEWIGR